MAYPFDRDSKFTKTPEEMEALTIDRASRHLTNVFKVIANARSGIDDVGATFPSHLEAGGSAGLITVAYAVYENMRAEVGMEFLIQPEYPQGPFYGVADIEALEQSNVGEIPQGEPVAATPVVARMRPLTPRRMTRIRQIMAEPDEGEANDDAVTPAT